MSFTLSSIRHKLLQPTSFFNIKLWIMIIIVTILVLVLAIFLTFCFLIRRRRVSSKKQQMMKTTSSKTSMNSRRLSYQNGWDVEKMLMLSDYSHSTATSKGGSYRISDGKSVDLDCRLVRSTKLCYQYTLKEIDGATNGFSGLNLVGSGDYGVVYHGILLDNTHIAVKKLLVNRGRLRDFKGDAELMWGIRHKNLVKLLGFCSEGTYRMLVYEYLDNGNLKQWLHQSRSKVSPLTWNIRMKIIEGIAKGLTYLHEDSEPMILHQHLKANNILLDKQWNPKLSDFGISSFLGPECSHPMGMSGYLAPEFAEKGILDVKSDVYSFGILVMEIVSGRSSVQQSGNEIEEYLVDWVKSNNLEENWDEIVDPKLHQMPPRIQLQRIILIALRCVDPEAENRPKMSEIIHMLEPRDLLLSDDKVLKKVFSRRTSFGSQSSNVGSFGHQSNKAVNLAEDCSSHPDLQKAPSNHAYDSTHGGTGK